MAWIRIIEINVDDFIGFAFNETQHFLFLFFGKSIILCFLSFLKRFYTIACSWVKE